jgi:pimeloyl-ACP methyl ester carboxylesterase
MEAASARRDTPPPGPLWRRGLFTVKAKNDKAGGIAQYEDSRAALRLDRETSAIPEGKMQPKTNVALVHGAWADRSSWSRVIPLLQKKGLNVVAAQLPLSSIDADIAVTKNLLAAVQGPVVLVGHSYGGVVISGAANGMSNVKALVYVAAFALDEGESIEGLGKQGPPPAGAAAVRPPDANGFLWIDRDGFAKAFAADVDPTEARVMAAVQKPLGIKSFTAKCRPPAWKHLPSWYMVATDDQMIPPQAEEFMAKRMGAEVRKVASSHAVMVSHSKEVADLITAAADAVDDSTKSTRVSV